MNLNQRTLFDYMISKKTENILIACLTIFTFSFLFVLSIESHLPVTVVNVFKEVMSSTMLIGGFVSLIYTIFTWTLML